MTRLASLCTLGALAFGPIQVQAVEDQHQVVPGERIGRIFLGDSRAAVLRRLGKPTATFQLGRGLTSDLWRSKKEFAPGQRDTLEIVYKSGAVHQIEVTNPLFKTSGGLSVASGDALWRKIYGPPRNAGYRFPKRGNRVQEYDDYLKAGVAIELVEKNDALSPQTLIVHRKNTPVVPDAGGVATR